MYDCTSYANIAHIICMKGNLLFAMANYEECVKLMTELIHSNPSYYPAYRIRGNAYRCLSIPKNANRDYEIADHIYGSLLKIDCKDTRGCEKRLFMNESSCTVYNTEIDSLDNIPKHARRKTIKDIVSRSQPSIAPVNRGANVAAASVDTVCRNHDVSLVAAANSDSNECRDSRDSTVRTVEEAVENERRNMHIDCDDEVVLLEDSPEYIRKTKANYATLANAFKRFDDQSEQLFQSFKFPVSSPLQFKLLLSPSLSEVVRVDHSAVTTLSSMTASFTPFSPASETGQSIEVTSLVIDDNEEDDARPGSNDDLPERKQSLTPVGSLKLLVDDGNLIVDAHTSCSRFPMHPLIIMQSFPPTHSHSII